MLIGANPTHRLLRSFNILHQQTSSKRHGKHEDQCPNLKLISHYLWAYLWFHISGHCACTWISPKRKQIRKKHTSALSLFSNSQSIHYNNNYYNNQSLSSTTCFPVCHHFLVNVDLKVVVCGVLACYTCTLCRDGPVAQARHNGGTLENVCWRNQVINKWKGSRYISTGFC